MATDPTTKVNKQNLPGFPYSENLEKPAVLVGAIVDPITKEVIGYLPLKVEDNGDGTCILVTKT